MKKKPTYEELAQKVKKLEDQLFFLGSQFEQVEKQLRQRQRMDSLGMLAQGVAHDFNNILSGIMAYLNLLSLTSDNFSESQKKYVQYIIGAVRRGAGTIKQFQKLSAGVQSDKADMDIHAVASEVFSMLEGLTDRMIEIKLEIPEGRFFVHADNNEVHQVFMNLGTNAVQAIEEKGVQKGDYIRLGVDKTPVSGQTIDSKLSGPFYHFCFEDTGIGIPENHLEKIFDPLFTTKADSKKKGQGLGLAMVNDIITTRHGGKIKVSSIPGKGTVFDLYLPRADRAELAPPREVIIQGGEETILVVDDDAAVRESVRTALEDFGYTVLTADDGEQGLAVFKRKSAQIDAVILDLVMPRMSGKELLRRMLKIDPDVKVIISSGHIRDNNDDTILKSARNYLKKPFEIDVLDNTLRQVLNL